MKILISGATGFIGTHLVENLLRAGIDLTALVRGSSNFQHIQKLGCNIFVDSGETEKLTKHCHGAGYNGVIHLATYYTAQHQTSDITKMIESNLLLGTRLLEAAKQSKVKWFLNTGTSWQHYNDAEYSPVNLYAATKQAFEDIARYYWEVENLCFCTLKLNDTYGPDDKRPKLLNLWKKNAVNGNCMDMSPGEQLIDIVHIDDVTNAFMNLINLLAEFPSEHRGKSYCISSQRLVTLRELAEIFNTATGLNIKINWGAKKYRMREIMIPYSKGTIVPGWEPKITLEEGLKRI
jgi:nucleoside-diphosphate-sugar epimerase